jgi:hypothetical protein
MSLFAPLLAAAFLVAVQGLLLQAACAVAGERPPRYGEALVTALLAAVVSTLLALAWGCTFGLVVGLLSSTLAWALSVLVGVGATASVYRTRLATPGPQAFAIALAHHAMAWAVSATLWGLLRLLT